MTNLPSGYHREMQLAKGPIIEAINELKSCLDLFVFTLQKISVKENILDDPKYQYVFSVDTLNEWVKQGMPLEMPIKRWEMTSQSRSTYPKTLDHTHLGSLGI